MPESLLIAANIRKSYPTGKEESLHVLRGISFEVTAGQIAAIVGASGAGKSTLLHIIGALDTPTEGEVKIDGNSFTQWDDVHISKFRNQNIGFVFQFHHLLPEFTAIENIMMPALIGGATPGVAREKAMKLLSEIHLIDRAEHKPSELSGGEQQRIAVARALINSPKLVLADEPSGNLDEENARVLHDLLWSLSRERSQTFLIVTHNTDLAQRADVILRLHDGNIETQIQR